MLPTFASMLGRIGMRDNPKNSLDRLTCLETLSIIAALLMLASIVFSIVNALI